MTVELASAPPVPDAEISVPEEAPATEFTVAEFFAGIGLARLGLEKPGVGFKVTWANDLDRDKHEMYRGHFGADGDHYLVEDVRLVADDIGTAKVPKDLSLAWASFPCTDLSLAGQRGGLAGKHSGTFWDFIRVLSELRKRGDQPPVVAIENVNGLATSHRGADIKAAVQALNDLKYFVDVVTIDARRFVPQSRPRLFLVGSLEQVVRTDETKNTALRPDWLNRVLDDKDLDTQRAKLDDLPALLSTGWTDLVDDDAASGVEWWDQERVAKFRGELSKVQKERVQDLAAAGRVAYRTAYRRTRNGSPAWEIRADDVAGCLRTARGGSSKQAVVRIEGDDFRVRWMTAREYAKLMGAPDYVLPAKRNQSIMGFGDAVCVDAVAWLAEHYLAKLLNRELLTPAVPQPSKPRQ